MSSIQDNRESIYGNFNCKKTREAVVKRTECIQKLDHTVCYTERGNEPSNSPQPSQWKRENKSTTTYEELDLPSVMHDMHSAVVCAVDLKVSDLPRSLGSKLIWDRVCVKFVFPLLLLYSPTICCYIFSNILVHQFVTSKFDCCYIFYYIFYYVVFYYEFCYVFDCYSICYILLHIFLCILLNILYIRLLIYIFKILFHQYATNRFDCKFDDCKNVNARWFSCSTIEPTLTNKCSKSHAGLHNARRN